MAIELSYVLITPYSLMKSRTGGIMARLLSRTDLELVGAQMLTFDNATAEKYALLLETTVGKRDTGAAELLSSYVRENFSEREDGKRRRVLMLLFRGEDACEKIFSIVGPLNGHGAQKTVTGETIRDTYADLVLKNNKVSYFEPAVLAPPTAKDAADKLRLFADFAEANSNVVSNIVEAEDGAEKTLVIIKPDNWRHPSTKPGNIIDMLSRTGLRIIGTKVYKMSVADALEFYGPVKNALRKKLAPAIGEKAQGILENEFGIKLGDDAAAKLTDIAGMSFADDQFGRIVEFMSGRRPEACPESELEAPGLVKCMILIYEGDDAISKIRTVLGPTDPTKAPGGTVRRDFGHDVMVNTAHASDSPESVKREMGIVKIQHNEMSLRINEYLNHNVVKI